MENFPTFNVLLENKFISFFSDFTFVAFGILLLFSAVFVFLLSIAYKKFRRKFPLKVNCWFCNKDTTIPYELSNNWDCPYCEQYNGFNKDGDYNKVIPEQYNYKLNEDTFKSFRTSVENIKTDFQTNGFCKLCNINQQLKIQQLALFVPLDENNYYEEIEEYREKLEKAYRLCAKCEKTLQETLEKQDYNSLQNKLNNFKNNFSSQKAMLHANNILILIKKNGILGLRIICNIIAISLFLALIIQFETENQYLQSALPNSNFIVLEPLLPVLKVFMECRDQVYYFRKELSFAGLICCFLGDFKKKWEKSHKTLLAWGILHISLWNTLTGLHVLTSGTCLFLSIQTKNKKYIYVNKNSLPKKSGFQPVKKIFSEVFSDLNEDCKAVNDMPSPLLENVNFTPLDENIDLLEKENIKTATNKSMNFKDNEEKKKKLRRKENEIELLRSEEKEKTESTSVNSSNNNNTFFSSVQTDKPGEDSSGFFNEVHNTFNNLQLGGKQKKKTSKPPNFLFAKHNFSEIKNSDSIIKPAKFIKNFNSTSWTESNECNSRSSTPSSGYSSQKHEKIEPNRYDFPKTVTPISMNSFSRQSPNTYYDYFDGNRTFFNNMNCFTPGFMPFQQFPGSLGHTTVYTCTRPTNFPFPLSPWPGYTPQKFSPTSRFSDSFDCDNLFQDSSRKYAKDRKWFKLKTFFYYFSIFLNFITIVGLVYFTSAGIILLDWKLPEFNFFM